MTEIGLLPASRDSFTTARARWGRALLVACACLALPGCGTESGTAKVTGVVTLDGKPVDGAAVGFIGRGGARLATAQTDSAGKFTLVAALGENVNVKNQVHGIGERNCPQASARSRCTATSSSPTLDTLPPSSKEDKRPRGLCLARGGRSALPWNPSPANF